MAADCRSSQEIPQSGTEGSPWYSVRDANGYGLQGSATTTRVWSHRDRARGTGCYRVEVRLESREGVVSATLCQEWSVEVLRRTEQLEELRPEWDALFDRCPWATPFQASGWQIPWWRHLGGGTLCAIAVRNGSSLVGIAPFFEWGRPGEPRRLSLLGAGVSDYQDVLVDPATPESVVRRIWEAVGALGSSWEEVVIEELRPDSPWLTTPLPPRMQGRQTEMGACSVLQLPSTMTDFESARSRHLRRSLRTARNRLERLANTRWVSADERTLPGILSALFVLHREQWQSRGQSGVLDDPRLEAFHAESSAQMLRSGLVHAHALEGNHGYLAVLYGFVHARKLYAYLTGFSPAMQFAGIGNLIVRHAIEIAIGNGWSEFDMLRGDEPYKQAWGASRRPAFRLSICCV